MKLQALQPELLTHPIIPRPLHGKNPRTVMGQKWWDVQRRMAYAKNEGCCWACGVHQRKAAYTNRLEAHESYHIDYTKKRVELKEIVALCHACHSFIHSERLWFLYQAGKITQAKVDDVLKHGMGVLTRKHLQPAYNTMKVVLQAGGFDETAIRNYLFANGYVSPDTTTGWSDWRLVLDGSQYAGKFADEQEWAKHYNVEEEML